MMLYTNIKGIMARFKVDGRRVRLCAEELLTQTFFHVRDQSAPGLRNKNTRIAICTGHVSIARLE